MGLERNVNNKVLADYQSYSAINPSTAVLLEKSIVMVQQINFGFVAYICEGLFVTFKPNKLVYKNRFS